MHFSFLQKFGGAVLVTLWLVWGSHMIAGMVIPEYEPPKDTASASAPASDAAAQPTAEEEPAEPQEIGPLLASASADDGASIFNKCKACHTIEQGGPNKVGPNLANVVGAAKAHLDDFAYSDALQGLDGEWTYEDLNAFLTNPRDFAPGTKMTFAGLRKAADRAAVIAYLREHTENPPPLP